MAGSFNDVQLRNIPRCHHGSMCVLKTGTSKNANHGKSFFICNSTEGRCAYASVAKDFKATVCPMHEKMVELKAFAKKENAIRCYFRCTLGKEKGETWCGHEAIKPSNQSREGVLKDITNHVPPNETSKELNPTIPNIMSTKSTNAIDNNPKVNGSKAVNETVDKTVSQIRELTDLTANDELPEDVLRISERLTSMVDTSKLSFSVPRDKRVSDISDATSADSSTLSKESYLSEEIEEANSVCQDAEIDRITDSSMLSNHSNDLSNNELNESLDNITQSSAEDSDHAEVYHVPKDADVGVTDSSMLSNKDEEKDNRNSFIVADSETDDSENEEVYDVPRDAVVNEVIDSSMLSNLDDEVDEITESLHSTSIHVAKDTPDSTTDNIRTDKAIDSSLFNIPRDAVVEKTSSTIDKDTNHVQSAVKTSTRSSNIIEISDSSDDEVELSSTVCPGDARPAAACKSRNVPGDVSLPTSHGSREDSSHLNPNPPPITPSMCWSKIQSLKLQIRRQQELYSRIGRSMPDGGRKLIENITTLSHELEKERRQFSELQKGAHPYGTLPMNVHYPTIINGTLQYTNPHHMGEEDGYGGPLRPAPLFGGRMTEKRLKEVGSITNGSIEQLHKSLESRPSPSEEAEDPKGLKVSLMTHQKQAMAWLLWREQQTPPGGILADDMGLGKTLTMISLALKSKQDELRQIKELPKDSKLVLSKGSVIICPASLIHQWEKEVEKRVKDDKFSVYVYHGGNREKRVKKLAKYDIVLTTYNIASIEGKKYSADVKSKPQEQLSDWLDSSEPKIPEEGPLYKIFWRRIILDEGHTIKNHKTSSSIAICAMEGESRWIVTGTPIQNNTLELYALIKFLRVTPFDEFKVWRREVDNKMVSGTKRMNSIVASLLLRRTKDQVDAKTGKPLIVLPKRTATLHKLKLKDGELDVYQLVQHYSKKVFKQFLHTRKDNDDGRPINPTENLEKDTYEVPAYILGVKAEEALSMLGLHGTDVVTQSCLLVMVLRLRQCCTHLSLMCEQIDPELCKSEGIEVPIEEQLGNLSIDEDQGADSNSRPKETLPTFLSSKISTLLSCLSDLKQQSTSTSKPIKSVIVSQWTRMLEIVAYHLKVAGYKYDFITGSVNVKKRSEIVENFNNKKNPEIMLVSLKAGGVGLNLIGGSHLFLLDQHWNPALEDQAADRIYRVGQKNDVTVHRFLCVDTVEERIAALQEKKKALANSVLYGGKMAQKLTLADLKMIFGLGM